LLEIGTGALQSTGARYGGSGRERTVVWCSPESKSGELAGVGMTVTLRGNSRSVGMLGEGEETTAEL
jgi:hypothetical protein